MSDETWHRLDPRMLLVHPVTELGRFLPVLVGIVVFGRSAHGGPWVWLGVGVPIALGLLRYVTTRYRVVAGQIELRRGLLSQRTLTARLDRVRTVELTASPIHRILGLAKVEIGTGSAGRDNDDRLVLDSLGTEYGERLRADLLHRTPIETGPDDAEGSPPTPDRVVLRFDPSWIRFAPLTSSGVLIALAALGVSSQVLGDVVGSLFDADDLEEWLTSASLLVAIPTAAIGFLAFTAVLAIAGYVLTNWGFTLTRDVAGRSWQVRRGLLTTRAISVETERMRGVEVHEPVGLRLGRGGRLSAIVTGLGRRDASSAALVPPAPLEAVIGVGRDVVGDEEPLTTALRPHGHRARTRRYTRALGPAVVVAAALTVVALVVDAVPAWVGVAGWVFALLAVPLAADRYARLGHALTDDHLVVRSGSLAARRDVLQRDGVIGWNLTQSFFQRRAGLVTLTATTAAGRQAYAALDIPEGDAVALAGTVTPGLITPFQS